MRDWNVTTSTWETMTLLNANPDKTGLTQVSVARENYTSIDLVKQANTVASSTMVAGLTSPNALDTIYSKIKLAWTY